MKSRFKAKRRELRKGQSNVLEKDHILILGFGNHILEIVRELIIANEAGKKSFLL
jgi:hypothetical protein